MKPAAFSYVVPRDLGEAATMLEPAGASPVSGNQSLGPMLNLRLARPDTLVDVAALEQLRAVSETDTQVRLGAAITHGEIEDGEVPDPTGGWMRDAAAHIAHRAVRNRGTLGGSLCHADPAADWVIVMTALNATAVIVGTGVERRVPVADFITGPYATALGPGEILAAMEITKPGAGAKWGYWKYVRQSGDFAKASAAILLDPAHGVTRCAIGALGGPPAVTTAFEDFLGGAETPTDLLRRVLPGRDPATLGLHVVALERAREAVT